MLEYARQWQVCFPNKGNDYSWSRTYPKLIDTFRKAQKPEVKLIISRVHYCFPSFLSFSVLLYSTLFYSVIPWYHYIIVSLFQYISIALFYSIFPYPKLRSQNRVPFIHLSHPFFHCSFLLFDIPCSFQLFLILFRILFLVLFLPSS